MITYSSAPPATAAVTYPAGVASTRSPARISTASTTANAIPAAADMARCRRPPTMTWLARTGWFIIAPAPMAWLPIAVLPMASWPGMALAIAVWLGIGLAMAVSAGMAPCRAGVAAAVIPVPRNTQAAKQTLRMVRKPMPALAL